MKSTLNSRARVPPISPTISRNGQQAVKFVSQASLVIQWLGTHMSMHGTWVGSLVWKDPKCIGAIKPSSHNYRAQTLQLLKPVCLEPVLCNKRSHHSEKPAQLNEKQLLSATRESLRTVTKTQSSQKFMNKINYFLKRFLSLLLQQK